MTGKSSNSKLHTWISTVIVLLAIPAVLIIAWKMGNKNIALGNYYVVGTAILVLSMVPFFLQFERRRPQARELTILAVLCASAVAARAAFAFVPQFKPMMGIVMITGIAFGPETGFLAGAISAFVSNFLFGQGPWTPWQMYAYGIGGLLAGVLIPRLIPAKKIPMSIVGAFLVLCVVGPVLDTSTLFMAMNAMNTGAAGAVYLSGLPMNAIHGAATFLTLLLLGEPILSRLERMKQKYGILGGR